VSDLFETATDQEALERAAAAATPTVADRVDLAMVHTLEPAMRGPMYALLSSLADNKYVLGRRYAEWCTGAPMLESAVAAAAMAQDELGHARSFYPLLRGFDASARDATQMEEKGWQHRTTSAMRSLDERFGAWADFVAVNLLIDSTLTTLLVSAVDSPYEPLRQRARKIQQEEATHWIHAAGWIRRLGASSLEALERFWDDAFTWYGKTDDPVLGPLADGHVLADKPDGLRKHLRARLEPVLDEVGIAEPLLARTLPWLRWDQAARRLSS
jgi:1,2-phenylacetyl-CoA epoxidase catalytic subunit